MNTIITKDGLTPVLCHNPIQQDCSYFRVIFVENYRQPTGYGYPNFYEG